MIVSIFQKKSRQDIYKLNYLGLLTLKSDQSWEAVNSLVGKLLNFDIKQKFLWAVQVALFIPSWEVTVFKLRAVVK